MFDYWRFVDINWEYADQNSCGTELEWYNGTVRGVAQPG